MIINMLAVCQLVKNVIKDSPSRSRFARYRDETPGQEGSCEVSSLKKFTSEIINIYHKKTPLLDRCLIPISSEARLSGRGVFLKTSCINK